MRRRWRQVDLAGAARVSQSVVARIELGRAARMTVEKLATVAGALDARIDVRLSWQGEGLDRLLDQDHATIVEAVVGMLRAASWDVRTEVTFWVRGERGSVDVLALHRDSGMLLVVEVKSVVPDLQAMFSAHDRKARLGREIAASVGWPVATVSRLLVIAESRTSRRRVDAQHATFEVALPDRGAYVRRWLRSPSPATPLRGMIFVSASPHPTARHRQSRPRREC